MAVRGILYRVWSLLVRTTALPGGMVRFPHAAMMPSRFRRGAVSRAKVIYRSTVDVPQIQRQADDLARDRRALDVRVQELNWRTELLDRVCR